MKRFSEAEYRLPFFDEYGYVRRLCPKCNEYFWTQNPDQKLCGESTPEGCSPYTFIDNPPTRKRYSLREMREAFLSFFEKHGHKRIKPYPVVARWRDDLYFTHASIIDFQPYVTEGITPPPANPLVISQPCIRFVDVDNVGPTFGRHLTIFEMGGHHAFNSHRKEVYWKDETVRYHHEFVTKKLGVNSEGVIYKEGVWIGGGNAGPDVESIIQGLEVATLVFMKFKVINDEFIELPIRTVDTGYGMERFTWISQGTVSCFHAVYDHILGEILKMAGVKKLDNELLKKVAELSGIMSLEKKARRQDAQRQVAESLGMSVEELGKMLLPVENAFAVADHTKCLVFMLSEGVVPSNVREGYLTRLMLRRTYRALRTLGIEEKLLDIVDKQIGFWALDFPHLKEMRGEILEILSAERDKFKETIQRGRTLVTRIAEELRAKGASKIPEKKLIELYDSHGLPPEIVRETAAEKKIQTDVPDDFYTRVAETHVQVSPSPEVEAPEELGEAVSGFSKTRRLYYEDAYISEFEAEVLGVLAGKRVVLDKTAFYPEGGGQPADHGHLEFDGNRSGVVDVQKIGNVIVHVVKGAVPRKGAKVKGIIDWARRISLMRHHTATHVLMGAARRGLGEHVWQSGAQKGVEVTRLDISHYKRLTLDEVHEIERLANEVVMRNLKVETSWVPREEAEKRYGFRLYQGGVVPGREIRVVKTADWEVEACGGTHCKKTGEIGLIKIVHSERIQDGVERLVFSAGLPALKAVQRDESVLWKVSEALNVPFEKVGETAERFVEEWKEARRERERLVEELAELSAKDYLVNAKEMSGLKVVAQAFKDVKVDRLIKIASELVKTEPKAVVALCQVDKTARIVIMAGKKAIKKGVNASEIAKKAASILGGGGSGRPDFAQGGGTSIKKVPEALKKVEEMVKQQVEGKK